MLCLDNTFALIEDCSLSYKLRTCTRPGTAATRFWSRRSTATRLPEVAKRYVIPETGPVTVIAVFPVYSKYATLVRCLLANAGEV